MTAGSDALPARLELRAVSKTFASMRVLHGVDLDVMPGQIHGLAGHNGSGKSTLVKILSGIHPPDAEASIRVDGHALPLPMRPHQAHAAGLAVVHQDLGLLDDLSVAENVCVGDFPVHRWTRRIDRRGCDLRTERALTRLGVQVPPSSRVGSLSAGHRAAVAMARAIRDHRPGAGVLVLDESTEALSGPDLVHVHGFLRQLARDGGAVLLVSHSLPELLGTADRITVLRDGRIVGAGLRAADLTEGQLAHLMLGRQAVPSTGSRPRLGHPDRSVRPYVQVKALDGGGIHGIDLTMNRGEIVGICGLPGSGFEDIPRLLTGAMRARGGELTVGGRQLVLACAGVLDCLRAGVVLVPERRDREGLAYDLDVRDNVCLPSLRSRGRPWFLSPRQRHDLCSKALAGLDVRPVSPERHLVGQLSGGNQQKVLLAKWLATAPELVVLHEPTQGVDVGARSEILRVLRSMAGAGTSVLLVSGEPEILAEMCDRVLVHDRGGKELVQLNASGDVEAILEGLHSGGSPAGGNA